MVDATIVNSDAMKRAQRAVLRVGGGRGFVVERRRHTGSGVERIVITAAHCLRELPPPGFADEYLYRGLLGPLRGKRTVWAECLFVDPVADIAVLGSPDNQMLSNQAAAYDRLIDGMEALQVTEAPAQGERLLMSGDAKIRVPTPGSGGAYVLSLGGRVLEGIVSRSARWLSFRSVDPIKAGMSGSPILSPTGEAIGLISTSDMGPPLLDCLPAHILRALIR
jgi:hypothetical protein